MYRYFPYFGLFVVSVLLQVFLFDNLSLSVYFNPLVYIAFLLLLPLDAAPIVLLLSGLLLGVTMDYAMGVAGINTIATLLVAFLRPAVARIICGRDNVRDGGIPSPRRNGKRIFLNYLIVLVAIHHFTFFALEALSWSHFLLTLLRVAVSGTVSVVFIWYMDKIFSTEQTTRIL